MLARSLETGGFDEKGTPACSELNIVLLYVLSKLRTGRMAHLREIVTISKIHLWVGAHTSGFEDTRKATCSGTLNHSVHGISLSNYE
jgi:hypothetical protein